MNDRRRHATRGREVLSLLHAAWLAEAEIDRKLNSIGLSLPKLLALHALNDAGESLPLGQLAERLSCVKSNITQLVDRLEADGYVARTPDPHDRRARLAVMTPKGRKAWNHGTSIREEAEREILTKLSTGEAQQLVALLEKVNVDPK